MGTIRSSLFISLDGVIEAPESWHFERIVTLHGTAGPFALQAAIAAGHARARKPADTDWLRIAAL